MVDVVARTKDAVVNISATKTVARRISPIGADPYWQQYDIGSALQEGRLARQGPNWKEKARGKRQQEAIEKKTLLRFGESAFHL